MRKSGSGERGTVSVFVAILATSFVIVVGLVVDGGAKLWAIAEARDVADNAARAGAQAVDVDVYRASGSLTLNEARAAEAAHAYLETVGHEGAVDVVGSSVTVTVTLTVPTRFLPGPHTVSATEQATATFSIATP